QRRCGRHLSQLLLACRHLRGRRLRRRAVRRRVMVTKPELGSEGWGEVLNAALDALQAAVDAKLPLTGGTLSDALAVQGPLAVTGTLTADDALTVSGAVATFAGLTST